MKHTYHIHGMTCNGCRSHVEQTLSKVEGVTNASVDLETAEATIEMEPHISIEAFQDALVKDGERYSIHMQKENESGTMKKIWDDICHEGTIKSPSWHEDILINREQAIKDGNDKFIDWKTAKTNILKEIK